MDIFQKLLQVEDETGGNVSNLKRLIDSGQLTTASQLPPIQDPFKEFEDRNPQADGGRTGFKRGTDGPGKSAFRKPFPPEIEKQIIKLHQVDKLGAQAIADKLGLSRSPVGKRITALKKEGIIKDIPVSERKASIDMRGEFFGKAPGEKYLAVREIRDIDRKTIDRSTGRLKFKIPKDAKYKVDFKSTGANLADVSNVPEKFRGVQYFKTKEAAEKAVADRKKLKLIEDVDSDEVRKKANKKKYDLVEEVSNNNIERILADFKKGQPIEKAHRLSLNQVRKTGEIYNVMNLGLDFDDPNYVQINNEAVKPYENKLKQLYAEQNKLYKQTKDLKEIPQDLRKKIEFNNRKISAVVDLAGGRVQGLQLDEFTLKPKVYGVNYANVLGFGLYDKPVAQLTKDDRAAIGAIMQSQVENEKKTAGKTAQNLLENKKFLKNVDTLTVKTPKELQNVGQRLAAIGCPGKAKGGRIEFNLGGSPECIRRGLENLKTGNMSPGAKANARQLVKNPSALTRFAKFAVGPLGIPTEIAFGGFFAATGYATGANKDEIVNDLTFGLFGKSMDEQAQERNPLYQSAKNLDKTFSQYLAGLDKEGKPLQGKDMRGMRKKTTYEDVVKAMEPFQRVNPQLESGQMFDLDMFDKAIATPQKLQEEKTQRALDRGFYKPGDRSIDPFQAADGGIAGLSGGVKSGPAPESGPTPHGEEGLPGILKRVKKG